jgi:hypothetical protein
LIDVVKIVKLLNCLVTVVEPNCIRQEKDLPGALKHSRVCRGMEFEISVTVLKIGRTWGRE